MEHRKPIHGLAIIRVIVTCLISRLRQI